MTDWKVDESRRRPNCANAPKSAGRDSRGRYLLRSSPPPLFVAHSSPISLFSCLFPNFILVLISHLHSFFPLFFPFFIYHDHHQRVVCMRRPGPATDTSTDTARTRPALHIEQVRSVSPTHPAGPHAWLDIRCFCLFITLLTHASSPVSDSPIPSFTYSPSRTRVPARPSSLGPPSLLRHWHSRAALESPTLAAPCWKTSWHPRPRTNGEAKQTDERNRKEVEALRKHRGLPPPSPPPRTNSEPKPMNRNEQT